MALVSLTGRCCCQSLPLQKALLLLNTVFCYFGKKKQNFHRTPQLHGSSALLCEYQQNGAGLGSANAGCTKQVATEETLLRLSKNQDVGCLGTQKGKRWEGSCRDQPPPKRGSKPTDSIRTAQSLGGYFPPFSHSFQQTKCHEKNTQEPSTEEQGTKEGQHSLLSRFSSGHHQRHERGLFWAGISHTQ